MGDIKKIKVGKPYKMETIEGALYGCEVFVKGISTVTCHAKTPDEARKIARGVAHCIEEYPVTFGFKYGLE